MKSNADVRSSVNDSAARAAEDDFMQLLHDIIHDFHFLDSLFLQVLTHVIFDDIVLIKLVVDIAFNNNRINQVYVIIDIPVQSAEHN